MLANTVSPRANYFRLSAESEGATLGSIGGAKLRVAKTVAAIVGPLKLERPQFEAEPAAAAGNAILSGRERSVQNLSLVHVIILAIVQGLAELLPVSSSAHVVVAEKLMGLDPSSPQMTLLLAMLHAGTMLAVIAYFRRQWLGAYFRSMAAFREAAMGIALASALTAVVGETIIRAIEAKAFHNTKGAQIEDLFSHLEIMAPALALGGLLIFTAGVISRRSPARTGTAPSLSLREAALIGAVQGLCLPFRGFSRSGATISMGMLAGVPKPDAERFSFALAVVLTPAAVVREALRLVRLSSDGGAANHSVPVITFSLLGAVIAFLAGLAALTWLSRWLEGGRWYLFGIYCLVAGAIVLLLYWCGY